jgi:uncharacterized protein YifN (PemK superfamily)
MPINFVPQRGLILICDYDLARIHPEMNKRRRVVAVSPRSYNRRHGEGPGRCLVIPFSASEPRILSPSIVEFPLGTYRSLNKRSWAICEAIMALSHDRLNRLWIGPNKSLDERLSEHDMARLEAAIAHAVGMGIADLDD